MNRPQFPTLAWNVPPSLMQTAVDRGVTVLIGCGFEGGTPDTPPNRLAWAAKAASLGLWVIADFLQPTAATLPPNMFAHLLTDEMDAKEFPVNQTPRQYNGWPRLQIRPLYDAFKRIAPDMPVAMTCAGNAITRGGRMGYYKSIADCSDIWISDGYPRSANAKRYTETLWPGSAVATLKSAAPNKPVYALIESGWQHLKDSPDGRAPTPDEVASAITLAVSNGASGIGYFSHYFNGNGGWVGFDNTTPEVAAVITSNFKAFNPSVPAGPTMQQQIDQLRTIVDAMAQTVSSLQNRAASIEAWKNDPLRA